MLIQQVDHLSDFTGRWSAQLADEVRDAVAQVAPVLAHAVGEAVADPLTDHVFLRNRLFALAVGEACGVDPADAMPVSVVSALWWAGAEELDDVADSGECRGLTAAVAALSLVPHHYVDSLRIDADLRACWQRDIVHSCLLAAGGQLSEGRDLWTSREAVLDGYRGKTGAAYARDAAMVARRAGHRVVEWERFGMLFGVLRQLHNDNHPGTALDNEDLSNATPTLRLAHAHAVTPPGRVEWLRRLRTRARSDIPSRIELDAYLHTDAVEESYRADVHAMHATARSLLSSLDVDSSVLDAFVTHAVESV